MNYPRTEPNIISQSGKDYKSLPITSTNSPSGGFVHQFEDVFMGQNSLPIAPMSHASGGFLPNLGHLSMGQSNSSLVTNVRMPLPLMPLLSQLPINQHFPEWVFPRANIFRRGYSNEFTLTNGFSFSGSAKIVHKVVKDKVKVKSESFDSIIIPSSTEMVDLANIKAEHTVFETFNGSVGHLRVPNCMGIKPAITLHPMPKNLQTKPREGYNFPNRKGLPRLDFVQRVSTTMIEVERKLYTCDMCTRNFKQKCHLYRHRRQHTGVKRFFCKHCKRGFYQSSNLRAHRRTHSVDNKISHPFACTCCTKRFTRNSSLLKHLARHTEDVI